MSTCNVEISNSFNPELQLRDTDSAIENKPIKLLSGLKGFQLLTTLVLELKKNRRQWWNKIYHFLF